jgi:hypothetical protein
VSPDTRQHRGAHPEDRRLFDPRHLPALRAATADLSWLLSRGYPMKSSLKIVGDRYRLDERQRLAVSRAACPDTGVENRMATCLPVEQIQGEHLLVDGFNLLITVEAALGGGVILVCRDGCLRDLSSVHGSYRSVLETNQAIRLVGETLGLLQPASVAWLLDQPISNSGRLAGRIRETAAQQGWPWSVEVVFNPDTVILASDQIAVTSDSNILDGVGRWINLGSHLIRERLPAAWLVDLRE